MTGARRATRRPPHVVLGVALDATPAEIRAAYHRRMRELHPDHTGVDNLAVRDAIAELVTAHRSLTCEQPSGDARTTGVPPQGTGWRPFAPDDDPEDDWGDDWDAGGPANDGLFERDHRRWRALITAFMVLTMFCLLVFFVIAFAQSPRPL